MNRRLVHPLVAPTAAGVGVKIVGVDTVTAVPSFHIVFSPKCESISSVAVEVSDGLVDVVEVTVTVVVACGVVVPQLVRSMRVRSSVPVAAMPVFSFMEESYSVFGFQSFVVFVLIWWSGFKVFM